MENKIEHNTEEHNIIVSDDKVEVVYTNVGAGCMLTGIGLMTLASLLIFFIVPDVSFVKGFFGVLIGLFGLLVFGSMLIRMLSMLLSRKHGDVPCASFRLINFGSISYVHILLFSLHILFRQFDGRIF